MSTEVTNATRAEFQGRLSEALYTSVTEARNDQVADGRAADPNATAYVVESGDTVSGMMAQQGLDWNDESDRAEFYRLNPQFAPSNGRDPNLIFPGEVLYLPGSGDGQQPGQPPEDGTVATTPPDANGNATFQNYRNGQPSGPPYQAQATASGTPANSSVIDGNGGMIRTGPDGQPLTGWAPTDGGNGSGQGEVEYTYYSSGRPTTSTQASDSGPPREPPPPSDADGKDYAGQTIGTGWYVVNGSSQGAQWAYFENGQRIAGSATTEAKKTDDPPPNLAPPAPQNGAVATTEPDVNGVATFQNYHDGQPVGGPYQARIAANGQPIDANVVDDKGGLIRTGPDGQPLTGWAPTAPGANGSGGGEVEYTYYINGQPTKSTVATDQGAPTEPPAPRQTDYASQPIGTGWYVIAGSSQGVLMAYFVDGHQIDGPTVANGKRDDPPPVIAPPQS